MFTERHLVETAQNVVDRQALQAQEVLVPVVREERVQRVQQELVERHQCQHSQTFERIQIMQPGSTCDLCGRAFRARCLRCRWCHIEVCQGCRRNRL